MDIAMFEIVDNRMTLTLNGKAYFKTFSIEGPFIGMCMDLKSEGYEIHTKNFMFKGNEKYVWK